MNKRAAKAKTLEGTITIGELRRMIDNVRGEDRQSRVNPAFHLRDTVDIFEKAIAGRKDDEVPRIQKSDPYSRTGRMMATRDFLLITNILREAG